MKIEFSKLLILFETALVFMTTLGGLILAGRCVTLQFDGALPWLVTMITLSWGAYGFSAKYYYTKAAHENSKGGIIYDMAMLDRDLPEQE